MIASGLTVVVAMALVDVFVQSTKSQNYLLRKYEVIDLKNSLISILSNDQTCACYFNGVSFPISSSQALTELKNNCVTGAAPVVIQGGRLPGTQTSVVVETVALESAVTEGPNAYSADLRVSFESHREGTPLSPIRTRIYFDVNASGDVATCRATGAPSGPVDQVTGSPDPAEFCRRMGSGWSFVSGNCSPPIQSFEPAQICLRLGTGWEFRGGSCVPPATAVATAPTGPSMSPDAFCRSLGTGWTYQNGNCVPPPGSMVPTTTVPVPPTGGQTGATVGGGSWTTRICPTCGGSGRNADYSCTSWGSADCEGSKARCEYGTPPDGWGCPTFNFEVIVGGGGIFRCPETSNLIVTSTSGATTTAICVSR
jgi:hypothetical protein